jgi:hypothetical protein
MLAILFLAATVVAQDPHPFVAYNQPCNSSHYWCSPPYGCQVNNSGSVVTYCVQYGSTAGQCWYGNGGMVSVPAGSYMYPNGWGGINGRCRLAVAAGTITGYSITTNKLQNGQPITVPAYACASDTFCQKQNKKWATQFPGTGAANQTCGWNSICVQPNDPRWPSGTTQTAANWTYICVDPDPLCGWLPFSISPASTETTAVASIPLSSVIGLVFTAFALGIVVSYIVYKCNKHRETKDQPEPQLLNDSSKQQLEQSQKSGEDSTIGEHSLNQV